MATRIGEGETEGERRSEGRKERKRRKDGSPLSS